MIRPVLIPREKPLPGGAFLVSIVSILAALLATLLLLYVSGVPPFKAMNEIVMGTFGDWYSLSEVIVKTTPLLICGLAVSLAFTMNIWNIGAEGQLYLGAIGASWVALTFPGLPAWVMIPAMMIGGMLGGLLWALGPALLKAKIQVNEIITTLMLNYVAVHLVEFMVFGPWKDPTSFGFPMTPVFSPAAELPALGTTRVHLGLVIGLALVVLVFFLFKKSRLGFTMRAIGANRSASRLSGMPVSKTIIISLCLSGAVAGLAGMAEVAGIQHRLQPGISPGYGYTAIIVAWLARLNPWAMVVVSFLFGALLVGGELLQITMKVSAHLAMLIQGLVLFFVLAGDFVGRFRVRWIKEEE